MNIKQLFRIICVLLMIVGSTFLIPIAVALFYGETEVLSAFLVPMFVTIILGLIGITLRRDKNLRVSIRGAFVVAALSWISASFLGAIPLYVSGAVNSVTDAIFESVSAFTTTGATTAACDVRPPVEVKIP